MTAQKVLGKAIHAQRAALFQADGNVAECEQIAGSVLAALPEATRQRVELALVEPVKDDNEYAWLIEAGSGWNPLYEPVDQPDSQTMWTRDAYAAHRYATREEAEAQIKHRGYTAEAIEHGFIPAQPSNQPQDPFTPSRGAQMYELGIERGHAEAMTHQPSNQPQDSLAVALSFARLAQVNRARCEAPDGFGHPIDGWTLSDWFTAAAGEFGEAANKAKKLNRYRDGIPGNTETETELRHGLADELADTVIYLDLLSQRAGIDLGSAVVSKFDRTSMKIKAPHRLGQPHQAATALSGTARKGGTPFTPDYTITSTCPHEGDEACPDECRCECHAVPKP